MRRINNRPVAVEAVLTRSGTVVGPFLSELSATNGSPRPAAAGAETRCTPRCSPVTSRRTATQLVKRLGDRLGTEGYRGFFEVDVLVDTDTHEVYLGEFNPRITGPRRSRT